MATRSVPGRCTPAEAFRSSDKCLDDMVGTCRQSTPAPTTISQPFLPLCCQGSRTLRRTTGKPTIAYDPLTASYYAGGLSHEEDIGLPAPLASRSAGVGWYGSMTLEKPGAPHGATPSPPGPAARIAAHELVKRLPPPTRVESGGGQRATLPLGPARQRDALVLLLTCS
jgi:hypothetical protein